MKPTVQPTLLPEPERRRVALHWIGRQKMDISPEDFTCWTCNGHNNGCESAWDAYNTSGDCLEMK